MPPSRETCAPGLWPGCWSGSLLHSLLNSSRVTTLMTLGGLSMMGAGGTQPRPGGIFCRRPGIRVAEHGLSWPRGVGCGATDVGIAWCGTRRRRYPHSNCLWICPATRRTGAGARSGSSGCRGTRGNLSRMKSCHGLPEACS